MNDRILQIAGEMRKAIAQLYGQRLQHVVIFGSHARGDAEEGSDIDTLVVLNGPVEPAKEIACVGEVTTALSLKYDTVISCTFISADRYATERSPLLLNVRREGVLV